MKVTGFTIVRNAIKYDYPVVESIGSVLPVCDAFVVMVGKSEDDTLRLIQSIQNPKLVILESVWDDTLREGGAVLAQETNKAFHAIDAETDWCFYIQADEVIHEKFHQVIRESMHTYLPENQVEGLLFGYKHFYGSYNYIADSRGWYRNEIRIIRNNKNIYSYKDAQGFRLANRKLRVKKIDAEVYHYGWVKHPVYQKRKEFYFHRFWHSDQWIQEHVSNSQVYDYSAIDSLALFKDTHPEIMLPRINQMDWVFNFDIRKKKYSFRRWLSYYMEKLTGIRLFEYKNYSIIK